MNSFNFFDSDERPSIRVGWRMIKTALAVFICMIIGHLRGTETIIFSLIAAIMCIQPTRDQSLKFAINRVTGTLIGGTLGAICMYLARLTGILDIRPIYYLALSIMLIPLMLITLLIRKPSATSFSCVVFLIVTVTRIGDASTIEYALNRMLETLIGVAIGLLVNWSIPKSKKEKELEKAAEASRAGAEDVAHTKSEDWK